MRRARGSTRIHGLKGPHDSGPSKYNRVINILPRPISSLPDMIRVVWTGKNRPKYNESIQHDFTINKQRVYNALVWLMKHNEDYKDVVIDRSQFERWPPVFVVQELLDQIGEVEDGSEEDDARTGVAIQDMDTAEVEGDVPMTTSAIIDIDGVSTKPA